MDNKEINLDKLFKAAVDAYVVNSLTSMALWDVKNITGVEFEDKEEALEKLREAIKNYRVEKEI